MSVRNLKKSESSRIFIMSQHNSNVSIPLFTTLMKNLSTAAMRKQQQQQGHCAIPPSPGDIILLLNNNNNYCGLPDNLIAKSNFAVGSNFAYGQSQQQQAPINNNNNDATQVSLMNNILASLLIFYFDFFFYFRQQPMILPSTLLSDRVLDQNAMRPYIFGQSQNVISQGRQMVVNSIDDRCTIQSHVRPSIHSPLVNEKSFANGSGESSTCSLSTQSQQSLYDMKGRFSRKVCVSGLPLDIEEGALITIPFII